MRTRREMFENLGLGKEAAELADKASHKAPKDRTPQEKEAIHIASEAIFNQEAESQEEV